jgi:hypothetical protein
MAPAAKLIKKYRETGQQGTLKLMASKDGPVGIIKALDVGGFTAHLLSQEDVSTYNNAKYIVNGPEDITGDQIVKMVEEKTSTKVQSVRFKDLSFIEGIASLAPEAVRHLILSIKSAPVTAWEGKCMASLTSKEVLELAAPRTTPAEVLETLLAQ